MTYRASGRNRQDQTALAAKTLKRPSAVGQRSHAGHVLPIDLHAPHLGGGCPDPAEHDQRQANGDHAKKPTMKNSVHIDPFLEVDLSLSTPGGGALLAP